jgi:glycosyltransferase involved in cell wall biosynthesis
VKIVAYIHPTRTYLPCTGVGRHINQLLLGLADRSEVTVELFFSEQWLASDGKLDPRSPLRNLPKQTFPYPENSTERIWKLLGYPKIDKYLSDSVSWVYAPMETYLPVTKCPVAITLHDIQAFEMTLPWSSTWQHRWFRYKYQSWLGRALKECRVVFTVSQFSKQRLIELAGADPEKVVVVGNGIEERFFEIAAVEPAKLKAPIARSYTLIVGGLRYKKGGYCVLQVAEQLRNRRAELQIVVVGESEPELSLLAQEHSNVTLLGMVPDEELPSIVRAASSLLFLSMYEGFGIPALEAMAAGVPVVVSNRGSLPEIVGDAGIIVDPEETDVVVDILLQLESDSNTRKEWIRRGQQHAAQYTWARCIDQVMNAFEQFA